MLGKGMMKLAQFNISAADKCVCFHHCSCRQSKGQAQSSGAWATAGTTSAFNHITVLYKVCRGHLHTRKCVEDKTEARKPPKPPWGG